MVQQRLLAIWKYDDEIGYLCGEIKEFTETGHVRVEGFDGLLFMPIKIIPYDEKYKKKLYELRENLNDEKKKLVNKYKQEFECFMGGIL